MAVVSIQGDKINKLLARLDEKVGIRDVPHGPPDTLVIYGELLGRDGDRLFLEVGGNVMMIPQKRVQDIEESETSRKLRPGISVAVTIPEDAIIGVVSTRVTKDLKIRMTAKEFMDPTKRPFALTKKPPEPITVEADDLRRSDEHFEQWANTQCLEVPQIAGCGETARNTPRSTHLPFPALCNNIQDEPIGDFGPCY